MLLGIIIHSYWENLLNRCSI